MRTLQELTRPNIWRLTPYASARSEYTGTTASTYLDANENPYNHPYNRYPDPLQQQLKAEIGRQKHVDPSHIFLGNGSDEAIDLLFRTFCEPGMDNVVAIDPTYGMYQVCAEINGVDYRKVSLEPDFSFRASRLLQAADEHTKLIFLCSPNNPTGNLLPRQEIIATLHGFDGLVVVDEAYIDFADSPSFLAMLDEYPNLVVLQTFSKAWGCAGIRLGMAFASADIVGIFNKIKYPYNVNQLTQEHALSILRRQAEKQDWVDTLKDAHHRLTHELAGLPCVRQVYPSDANFVLVRVDDAMRTYDYLVSCGIIVRNRHTVSLCGNCLRITIGTADENARLVAALQRMGQ